MIYYKLRFIAIVLISSVFCFRPVVRLAAHRVEVMRRLHFRKMTVISLTLLLFGCATGSTYQMHEGGPRPDAEVAIIKPWVDKDYGSLSMLNAWPASIDGKTTEPYRGALPAYRVLPGEHTIVIGFNYSGIGKELGGEDPEAMSFTAKAGHVYLTKASAEVTADNTAAKVGFWIEDESSGEVVAGTRPLSSK